VNWFIKIRESQILGLLNEIAAPLTLLCGGRFRDGLRPAKRGQDNAMSALWFLLMVGIR
jgi:hypothetical protein